MQAVMDNIVQAQLQAFNDSIANFQLEISSLHEKAQLETDDTKRARTMAHIKELQAAKAFAI
jgi:hypothetical protein